MRWRLVSDDGVDAAAGLAADEALMAPYGRSAAATHDATLRLYSYRSHCALVGRFQSLEDEVDLGAAERLGIQVARRPTGGGAIIMGAGQLGVAVATPAPAADTPRDLLARYAHGIVAGLATLGVTAEMAGKNDLQVGGRKIAGLGLHVDDRGALLFHASVLGDLDVELMLDVLRIPGAKLADKPVARVQERITTVSRELGRPVPLDELRAAVAGGFATHLGVTLEPTPLSAAEAARRDVLVGERYAADGWTRQRSRLRDAHGTATLKTPEGLVRIYVATHGATVKSVLVAGDFNALPAGLSALESTLRWTPATHEAIAETVARAIDDHTLDVPAGRVAAAVWAATDRALGAATGAHPVRPAGSCYFPDPVPTTEPELV